MAYQWLEIILPVTGPSSESVSDHCFECGAQAVTLEGAANEHVFANTPAAGPDGEWQQASLIALFAYTDEVSPLLDKLSSAIPAHIVQQATIRPVAEEDWVQQTRAQAAPMTINDKLIIAPTWAQVASQLPVLRIDPGLAFGTGSHPTTQMCLEWLAAELPSQACVVDYGCGSGILGLAACKLGAAATYAVDIDPQACQSAMQNALLNDCIPPAWQCVEPTALPSGAADVVVANILFAPLCQLVTPFKSQLKPQGKLVMTGVLNYQVPALIAAFKPYFTEFDCKVRQDWACVTALRLPGSS